MALRIGIVGCGKIADGHAEVLQHLPEATLVSVCDLEPVLAEQLAVRFRVPRWYGDLAEMLAAERLDVLHITTPPQAHLALVRQAVREQCHVFLEKPVAPCSAQTAQIIDAVRSAGMQLCVNYWPNFEEHALRFRDYLEQGSLGQPVHIESYIGYDLSGAYGKALMSDPGHWVHRLPGRLFQNMMDHIFNRIVPLLPEDETKIEAVAFRRRPEANNATDSMLDELRVVLRAGNISAYATLSSHARPVANTLHVYGTKNTVELDYNRRTFVVEAGQAYPSALGRLIPPFQMARRYWSEGLSNVRAFGRSRFHFFAGMTTLLSAFYQGIRRAEPPPIAYSEILRTAEIMDQVIQQVYPPVIA